MIGEAPANGFGQIQHPPFGPVDITAVIPGGTLTVNSGLDAYTIDLEVTKNACLGNWRLVGIAGMRYAEIDQSYFAHPTSP